MPSILLEKKGDYFGESLFGKIAENNFITLEGDFNKYFMLGVQEGYEIEALQIFTPDVMATLIDKAKSFSMEIVNNQLFIYANKTISTKQELENFYDLAEYFSHEIIPVLIRMKSSIEAMKKYTN